MTKNKGFMKKVGWKRQTSLLHLLIWHPFTYEINDTKFSPTLVENVRIKLEKVYIALLVSNTSIQRYKIVGYHTQTHTKGKLVDGNKSYNVFSTWHHD